MRPLRIASVDRLRDAWTHSKDATARARSAGVDDVTPLRFATRLGVTLERAIADAAAGVVSLALHGAVEIACDRVDSFIYDDAGLTERFQGLLTVEGVTYRFRCSIFTDGGGSRYVEEIGELDVVQWGVRLAVPGLLHGR